MIIEPGALSEDVKRFTGEEQESCLDLDNDLFFRAAEPAQYDLYAQLISSEVLVRGSVAVQVSCRCARCDEWFLHGIHVEGFVRTYKPKAGNEPIDLTDDIREDILLALPAYFICSPSCAGLCARCGANLNKQKCSCAEQEAGKRRSAFDRLNIG